MSDVSIHDLMDKVRYHDKFIGGILFTADDVDDVKDRLEADGIKFDPSWEWRDEDVWHLTRRLEYSLMNGGDWETVVQDFLMPFAIGKA